jgi:hypothetical protein
MMKKYARLCRLMLAMFLLLAARVGFAQASPAEHNLAALHRAVADLAAANPDSYPGGAAYLERVAGYEKRLTEAPDAAADPAFTAELAAFQREALLANPLLSSVERILVVKRNAKDPALGLPQNWQGNCSLPQNKYDNEIAFLSMKRPEGPLATLYKPDKPRLVGDVQPSFDGQRILFSMPGSHDRSQIWELRVDGSGPRQVTVGDEEDVDNYMACYLPDGRIIYGSTANYQGVPCVYGGDSVANLCIMNADGSGVRQLTFDQDHDWYPAVLNNGRILYTRWEYTDTPHSNTRLLFHMNPDGTGQMEYYGSNSYWPTSVMYAKPIPNHPTKVVAIVSGHHGVPRMGELVVLDPALGRSETEGAVQRIPGWGKPVPQVTMDNLVDNSWPKFLHPYPLSDKYFLVAAQPTAQSLWGIYLVDIFDNMTLLREEPGHALLEPVPVQATPAPPAIPDKARPGETEATVYIADIYSGPGLTGIPRGTVKALRLLSYSYAYRKMGGLMGAVGMDGPWDVKRIVGTVPVEEDGSAFFNVPANIPIAVQPLDAQGRALQLMRSWFTAMPGEAVSCVGCHDRQNSTPPSRGSAASRGAAVDVTPWRGPARGFSFAREVQPVLDRYCLSCHDGKDPKRPDLRGTEMITDWKSDFPGSVSPAVGGKFSVAYASLHRYVRRPGIESDYHLLTPMEFHGRTTELVQLLEHGHHGVTLDAEAWDRINTWIDLNTPYHGTWTEIVGEAAMGATAARRRELMRKYANVDVDHEAVVATEIGMPDGPVVPAETPEIAAAPVAPATPVEAGAARSVDLGDGLALELVQVPAEGSEKPFWMGRFELTNDQYARFDAAHDSGVESMHSYQFGVRGYPVNGPKQPVVRVSWNRAMDFCKWLSEKTGERFTLPTEAQWEHACRAGTHTPFWYGGLDSDFAPSANLGDARLREYARNNYIQVNLLPNPNKYDNWVPQDARFDDGSFLPAEVGHYAPNPYGLHDMHGNVWEWTASDDGTGRHFVRGGSWYDRPYRAAADYRMAYDAWQPAFNVGFRVVCLAK